MKIFRFLTICLAAAILTGCACCNTINTTTNRTTTIGQELMDLQKAKESGAMTDEEYDTAKGKLIKMAEVNSVTFKSQTECNKK
jgi:uncharacterized lipoprotein YajG